MSKLVDLLSYGKRSADKKGDEDMFSAKILSENFDTDTKEKIASTYIFNPPNKSESLKKATDEDRYPSPNKSAHPSAKIFHLFPWLISLLAILLLLVNIAYRGKINIKIEVLKDDGKMSSETASDTYVQKGSAATTEDTNTAYVSNFLILNGQINNRVIKKIGFYGAALRDSRIQKDGIYLINDGTIGWASAGFDLAQPADLTNSSLEFFVKGLNGDESMEIILRDSDNNSYLPQAHNLVFNKNMGGEWQFVSIPFGNFKGYYNSKHVNHIGFEFGTQTTSNNPGATIYIRNIKIVKK